MKRTPSLDDPEFLACNANVDIARREADIGVRNRRPEQGWLAGQRPGVMTGFRVWTDEILAG